MFTLKTIYIVVDKSDLIFRKTQRARNDSLEDVIMAVSLAKTPQLVDPPTQESDESTSLREEAWHTINSRVRKYKHAKD